MKTPKTSRECDELIEYLEAQRDFYVEQEEERRIEEREEERRAFFDNNTIKDLYPCPWRDD